MSTPPPNPYPAQSAAGAAPLPAVPADDWDLRDALDPRRLAIAMWDFAYLGRHRPGQAMADYPAVLRGLVERGYNCVRIDPFPQLPDYLEDPDRVYTFPEVGRPFMPWGWNDGFSLAAGRTVIDFIEETRRQGLRTILSAWWLTEGMPAEARRVESLAHGADLLVRLLETWRRHFGFEGIAYVDLCNEFPYFIPGFLDLARQSVNLDWHAGAAFTAEQSAWLAAQINPALRTLQRAFPELLFTVSLHGDTRWIDVPLECDCLDVHFYADADPRWENRTRFHDFMGEFFTSQAWHAEFSARWRRSAPAYPLFRARQRAKMAAFASWSRQRGMPLTTTEGWSAWYADHAPDYDLGPLLAWSEWALEDAIALGFWGWTAHSFIQPQYGPLWNNLAWHQHATARFLA
jgi:hypothetical protein